MTLIVAEAHADIAFMVGDTLLSHTSFQLSDEIGPVGGEFHTLKIQVLNGSTVVAFAELYEPAMERVRSLDAALRSHSTLDAAAWMSDQASVEGCDFLLLTKNDKKNLHSLIEGKFRECQRAFIGDLYELPFPEKIATSHFATVTRAAAHEAIPNPELWLELSYPFDQLRFTDHAHLDERSALILAKSIARAIAQHRPSSPNAAAN